MRKVAVVSLLGLVACKTATPAAVEPMSNAAPATAERSGEPDGFLFVDNFDYGNGDDGESTYNGRPFAISLNTGIPGHAELRRSLAWHLHDAGVVEQVALEPFGEGPPPFIEIHVGDLVPVAVTQAVLEVYGREQSLPLHVGVARTDEGFGNRTRLYVGSLVQSVRNELTDDELTALLLPGHDAASFYNQIPAVPVEP